VKGITTWPREIRGGVRVPLSIQWETNGITRALTISPQPNSATAIFIATAFIQKDGKILQRYETVTHTLGSVTDFTRFLEEARASVESFNEATLIPAKRTNPFLSFFRYFLRSPLGSVQMLYNKICLAYLNWREARRKKAISEPRRRGIYFKLPLKQTEYHWEFKDRKAFLSGRLNLTVTSREGLKTSIPVIDHGGLCDGWKEIGSKKRKSPNNIYFGFYSTKKFLVSNRDAITIKLELFQDVTGMGPNNKGVLKAGVYSTATEFTIYETNGRAYTGDKNCEPLWDLQITENRGWMADRKETDH
jgi:hypothetical protein